MLTTPLTGDMSPGGWGRVPSWLPLPPPAATSALAGGQPWRWEGRAVPATCAGVGDAPLQPGEEDGRGFAVFRRLRSRGCTRKCHELRMRRVGRFPDGISGLCNRFPPIW